MKVSGLPVGANYAPVVPRRPPPAPQPSPSIDAVIGADGDGGGGPIERGVFLDVKL